MFPSPCVLFYFIVSHYDYIFFLPRFFFYSLFPAVTLWAWGMVSPCGGLYSDSNEKWESKRKWEGKRDEWTSTLPVNPDSSGWPWAILPVLRRLCLCLPHVNHWSRTTTSVLASLRWSKCAAGSLLKPRLKIPLVVVFMSFLCRPGFQP